MTDEELIAKFVAGDRTCLRELVGRHHQAVLQVARYYAGQQAEDVAQETWLAVCRGAKNFAGRSSFKTWLLTICANRARDMGYRESRHLSIDLSDPVAADRFSAGGAWRTAPVPVADRLADQDERAAILALVRRSLSELGEPTRTVVTLRDIEGLDTREVAEILHLSEGNVRVLLHRGRAAIRSTIEAEGGQS